MGTSSGCTDIPVMSIIHMFKNSWRIMTSQITHAVSAIQTILGLLLFFRKKGKNAMVMCFESFNSTNTVIPVRLFDVRVQFVWLMCKLLLKLGCEPYLRSFEKAAWSTVHINSATVLQSGLTEVNDYWCNYVICISAFSGRFIEVQFVCYCCLSPNKLHAEELTFFPYLLMQAWNQTWFQTKQPGPRLERV